MPVHAQRQRRRCRPTCGAGSARSTGPGRSAGCGARSARRGRSGRSPRRRRSTSPDGRREQDRAASWRACSCRSRIRPPGRASRPRATRSETPSTAWICRRLRNRPRPTLKTAAQRRAASSDAVAVMPRSQIVRPPRSDAARRMPRVEPRARRTLARRPRAPCAQRSRKAQPCSSPIRLGTTPGMAPAGCPASVLPRHRDAAQQPARVGVRAGRANSSATGAGLDELAGVHHRHPVGDARDHAEVVRDEDIAMPNSRCSSREQPQDLRLDRHVERGGRLVGDDEVGARTSAPSRSSRAGAARRRAGADTGAAGRGAR